MLNWLSSTLRENTWQNKNFIFIKMPLYTLSSTDSNHYNRIRVSLPMEMSSKFINICVNSLTANANFKVLNDNDYIEFNINNTSHKLKLKNYSKLTSASLPYLFQELLNEQSIPITVSMSDIDTIIFSSSEPFKIVSMSYNAKLITGFYSTKSDDFPISSIPYETTEEVKQISENIDIQQATVSNVLIRKGYTTELKLNVSPPTANGYSVEYEILNDSIVQINFSDNSSCEIEGLKVGTTSIRIKIKNPNTSKSSEPDFVLLSQIEVINPVKTEITNIVLPEQIYMKIDETKTLYPVITPSEAGYYIESWESYNNSVATVSSGTITAISEGETQIMYHLINRSDTIDDEFTFHIKIIVQSNTKTITNHMIQSSSVGYFLSTPILYLVGIVGAPVFSNQIDNSNRMNSGSILMILNNSFSSSFPIVQNQSDIIVKAFLNYASDFSVYLVDANFREVDLLNPFYIVLNIEPESEQIGGVMI